MNRLVLILLAALFAIGLIALTVPMWVATSHIGMPVAGWGAVVGTVFFCFLVGGGLMFLVFYSARHGHDEAGQLHGRRDQGAAPPHADDKSR